MWNILVELRVDANGPKRSIFVNFHALLALREPTEHTYQS